MSRQTQRSSIRSSHIVCKSRSSHVPMFKQRPAQRKSTHAQKGVRSAKSGDVKTSHRKSYERPSDMTKKSELFVKPRATPFYDILCYTLLRYTMLRHATILYYVMLRHTTLSYTILCHDTPYYAIRHYTMPCCAILRYPILYYTILCYAMLCYGLLCQKATLFVKRPSPRLLACPFWSNGPAVQKKDFPC